MGVCRYALKRRSVETNIRDVGRMWVRAWVWVWVKGVAVWRGRGRRIIEAGGEFEFDGR
jgi:hypothetical protein